MSVHYKFKSTLDYDTITFDGLHISVADLKKAILQQKRLNKIDFDLQIVNAQTKEEYQHENTLIPKNTSLIISRVPLANPGRKQQYWDKQTSNQLLHMQSRKPPPFPLRSLKSEDLDLYKMEGSEEQKIDAMMAQSAGFYDPKSYHKIRPFPQTGEVPITYRCNKCKRGGHWIKNCPYNISKDHGEVKRTTGIPKSFIDKEERNLLIQGKEPLIEEEKKQEIPDDLICSICHDLFIDAVMIPCCGSSFCDDCVRCALLESEENECPDCKEKGCSPESLIPNRFLRKSVNSFKNRTGYKTPLLQKKVQPKDNEVNVKLNKANVPLVRPKDTDEKRDEEPTSNNKKNLVEQNKQITDATVIAVVDAPTVLSASIAAPATAVVPTTIVVPITASSVTLKGKEVDPETARQSEDVEAKTQEKIVDAETKTATPTISDNKKKDTKEEKLKENVPASLIPTAIGNKSNDDVEKGKNKEKDKEKDMLSPNHEESDYEDNIVVTIMPPIDNSPAEKYLHNPHPRHGPHASHLISSPIHKHQIPPYHSDDGGGGVGGVGIGMPGNHKDWDHNIREKYTNEHHENIISENIYLSPERPRALLKAPDIPLQPPGMQHGQLGPLYGPILPHPPYADIHNAQQPRHMGPRPLNMHPGYHNPLHNRAPIYSQHPSMPLHHQVGGLHHSVAPVPRITMPLLNAYEQPYNPIGTLASGYPRYPPPTMMPARFTYAIREVPENITTNYPLRSYTNLTSVYEEVQAKVGVGIIDDPLEAFNRIMKEKEKKKDERRSPERRHRSKERHVRKPFRQSPYNHRIRKDMGHYHYHDKRARSRDHDMERSRWNQYAKDQEREQDRERDRNRKPIPLENDKRERDKDINYRLRRSKSFDKISRSRSHSPKRYRCASPALMTTKNYNANDKHHQQKFRHDEPLVSPVEDVNPDSRELTLHQHQHYKHPRKSYDEDSEPPPPGSEFLHSRNPFHGSRNGSDRNLSPSSHLISSEATYCRDNEEDWLNMHNPTPDLYEKCVSGDVEESRTYNVNRQTYSRSPVRRMSHGSMLSSKSRSRSPASSYGNDKRKRYKCSTTPRGGPLQLSSNNNNNHNYNNKKDKGREKEDLERYAGYVANHNVGHKSEDKSSGQRMERKDYHQHQQHQHHKQRSQDDDEDEEVVGREIRERKHSMTPGHGKVDTRTATVSPEMDRDCKSESKKSDKKLKERKKKRKEKKENKKPKKEKKAKKERYKSKSQDKEEPEDDEEEEEEDEELEENESKQQQNDMNKNENNVKKIERTIDSKTKLEVNQMISNKDNMNLITKSKAESDNFDIDKLKTYDQQNDQIIIEKSSRDKEKENIAITNDSTSTQATSATVASTNINDSSTLQYNDQQNHKSNEKKSPLSMSTSTFTANIKSLDAVLDIHEHETDFDGNTFKRQENNVTFNKIVPETSKWEIEEPQPDNLIIISNNVGHNDKIDYSSKSSTVESSVERVTNDIIVRAEKAIFARAINAIRPIETSKKSISQESSTNTKSFGVITGSSSTYHHHHHHHHTESSSDIKNIQITLPLISSGHKERSIELKSTDNFSEQKKKSVKERLGSKVTQQPLISHINDVHKEGGIGGNGNDNDTDNQHCETERYKRSGVSGALDSKIITKRNEFDKNYRSCRNNDHRNYNIQLQQQQLPFHYEKEREREHNKDKQRDKQAESDWQRGKDKNRGEPKNQKSDQSRQRERNRERERDNEREKERDRERDHNRERERDKERNRNRERTHDRDRGRDRDRERSQNLLKSKIIKDNLQSSTASLAHRHPPKTTSERSTATSTTHKRQYESTSPRRKRKSVSDTNTSSDHHSSRDDEDDRDKHKHIKLDRKGHKQQQQTQQQHQEHSDSSDSGDENSKKSKRKNKSSKKKKKSRK